MKKLIFTIIILLTIVPCVVLAGTCKPDDIELVSVTLSKTIGNGVESNAASIDDKKVNLDVKLNDPNDYMEYTIKVRNSGTEDYYIKEEDLSVNNYMRYELLHEGSTYKIEPNSEKEIVLRVIYKDRVEGTGNYTSTDTLKLDILDKQDIRVGNTLMNLSLGLKILIALVLIAIIVGLVILFVNNKKSRKMLVLLIGIAIFIPISSNASCDLKIDVDVKVELDNKNAIFKNGSDLNILMKTLAGGNQSVPFEYDSTITAFKKSSTAPTEAQKNIASSDDSTIPIYMWYSSGTIYWWSEDDTPSLNENSGFFFGGMRKLTNIEGATTFDSSNATDLSNLLAMCEKLADLTPLTNWNTSKNTTLQYTFYFTISPSMEFLRNWDTSKVTDFSFSLGCIRAIDNFNFVEDWDVSSATNMRYMFNAGNIADLTPLRNWDVSKVENMFGMFYNSPFLTTLDGLENWDTSNVTDMGQMFTYSYYIANIDAITNWNMSKVTNLEAMFCYATELTSINLNKWDVSKVEKMNSMFANCTGLVTVDLSKWVTTSVTDVSYMFNTCDNLTTVDISNFDTRNVTTFERMFNKSPLLTTIYIGENWDTSANEGEYVAIFNDTSNLPNFDEENSTRQYLEWAKPTTQGGYLTLKTNN